MALLAFASLAATACGDDSTAPGGPITEVEVLVLPYGTPTTNVRRGITLQLLAVPINRDSNFVDIPITWASSDQTRATVDANGVVTTVAGGDVTITATAGGQTGEFDINIQYPVGSVTLSTPAGSIRREGSVTLVPTILGTDGTPAIGRTVTWTSSSTAIATVSSTGVVSGVADGTATITATSEGVSGTRDVVVSGPPLVATVALSPLSPFKGIGQTQQMTHSASAASGTAIPGTTATWASSNTSVATVSATGLVTVLAAGTANITATVDNGAGTNVTGTTGLLAISSPVVELATGAQTAATATPAATATWYSIVVPAGATSLTVTTANGTGDADVYIFAPGVTPSAVETNPDLLAFSNSTARSTNVGNIESVTRSGANAPAAGVWRIAVFAWGPDGPVGGLNITATRAP